MADNLDRDVVADCCAVSDDEDDSDHVVDGYQANQEYVPHDLFGVKPRQEDPVKKCSKMGVKPRDPSQKTVNKAFFMGQSNSVSWSNNAEEMGKRVVLATKDITDDMIEDGSHVVFDWDNTLKLYDRQSRQLSCRVSKDFLLHLQRDRGCHLYIISAIQPSAINLGTILSEVEKLGLTDIFVQTCGDVVDAFLEEEPMICSDYAQKGNIIICGYNKAETFLKLSSFNSGKGDKVVFFDDEEVNIYNFSMIVPNSMCYHCK